MKTTLRKIAAVALMTTLAVAVLGAQAFADSIFADSFETPEQAGHSWSPQVVAPGWAFSGVQSFLIDTVDWPQMGTPPDGTQFETVYAGYIWKNSGVAMVEGATYTLKAVTNTELQQSIGVAFGLFGALDTGSLGLSLSLGVFSSNGRGNPWTERTVSYTCDAEHAGRYLAVLLGDNGLGVYACYDNVRLDGPGGVVPEPSSMAALAFGGLGLVPVIRRRRF